METGGAPGGREARGDVRPLTEACVSTPGRAELPPLRGIPHRSAPCCGELLSLCENNSPQAPPRGAGAPLRHPPPVRPPLDHLPGAATRSRLFGPYRGQKVGHVHLSGGNSHGRPRSLCHSLREPHVPGVSWRPQPARAATRRPGRRSPAARATEYAAPPPGPRIEPSPHTRVTNRAVPPPGPRTTPSRRQGLRPQPSRRPASVPNRPPPTPRTSGRPPAPVG